MDCYRLSAMGSGSKNIIAVALISSMIAVSCLPDPLQVHDVPQLQQKIVVSSQMTSEQTLAILLTKSIGALDASDDSDPLGLLDQIAITDAEVHIEGNGKSFTLNYLGYGVYTSDTIPLLVDETYTLFVVSPTAGSVKSTTTVKSLIEFSEVTAEMYISGRDTLANISYKFNDHAGKNWYMINGQHITRANLQERVINPRVTTKMIDDAEFEGGEKSDSFKILFDEVEPGDTLAVSLSNINKDYYDFMKLRGDTSFGLAAALGEPINYPANVEGGLGFFNLYVPDVRTFILEE